MQGYWADQRSPALHGLPDDLVVLLPLGATEQHGPHLPLSVDTDLASAAAAGCLPHLTPEQNVLILPALSVTKSNEHNSFPGTLSLQAETLLAVLRDLMASLARSGVTRMLLLNGHGGNTALLEVAAREGRIDHGMIVAHASWSAFADYSDLFDARAVSYDLHAGDFETSAMLAVRPDVVDMHMAQNFRTAMQDWEDAGRLTGLTGQPARPGWVVEDLNADGALGNAAAATEAKGKALMDRAAQGLARWLADFATFEMGQ
ncbi:MAG: creatininase family protein [Pseudomonadota bacterium]